MSSKMRACVVSSKVSVMFVVTRNLFAAEEFISVVNIHNTKTGVRQQERVNFFEITQIFLNNLKR